MNTETLEKMQWLYEQGFVPDMWTGTEGHIFFTNGYGSLLMANANEENGLELEENQRWDEAYCPYFTESRLWSLLPETIEARGCIYDFESSIGRIGYWTEDVQRHWLEWEEIGDLHTALLDLTVWAVTQGHLKAEVINGSN